MTIVARRVSFGAPQVGAGDRVALTIELWNYAWASMCVLCAGATYLMREYTWRQQLLITSTLPGGLLGLVLICFTTYCGTNYDGTSYDGTTYDGTTYYGTLTMGANVSICMRCCGSLSTAVTLRGIQ